MLGALPHDNKAIDPIYTARYNSRSVAKVQRSSISLALFLLISKTFVPPIYRKILFRSTVNPLVGEPRKTLCEETYVSPVQWVTAHAQ